MNTTANIPPAVQAYYDRTLLERATPLLVYERFGQRRPLPANNGTVIKFRRYNGLPPATVPLTEGVTPSGSNLSVTDITAEIQQYGDFVKITDKVQLTVEDPVVTEASEILGEQEGETIDTVTRDALLAGTNVVYANKKTSRGEVADKVSADDLDLILKTLERQNAKKFTQMIVGSTKVSTEPVAPSYIGIVHTDTVVDLEKIEGFLPVEKYANTKGIYEGEVGKYKRIRFIATTNAKIFEGEGANGGDVYGTLIFGQNAYGLTPLTGQKNGKVIIKPLGSAGTEDPLNQRATVGWKAWHVAKILNDAYMVRYEHA